MDYLINENISEVDWKYNMTNRQRRRVLKHIDRFYHNQVKPELRLWKNYFNTTGGLYYNDVGVIYDSSRYAFKIKLKKRPFNENISEVDWK